MFLFTNNIIRCLWWRANSSIDVYEQSAFSDVPEVPSIYIRSVILVRNVCANAEIRLKWELSHQKLASAGQYCHIKILLAHFLIFIRIRYPPS